MDDEMEANTEGLGVRVSCGKLPKLSGNHYRGFGVVGFL